MNDICCQAQSSSRTCPKRLTWYKVGIGQTNFFWHVSYPTSPVFHKIFTLDNVIFIGSHGSKIIHGFTDQWPALRCFCCCCCCCCCFSLGCFGSMFSPHAFNFVLTILVIPNRSNIHVNGRRSLSREKGWIVCHMWLIMFTFHKMIRFTGCHPFAIDTNTAKSRRRRNFPCPGGCSLLCSKVKRRRRQHFY